MMCASNRREIMHCAASRGELKATRGSVPAGNGRRAIVRCKNTSGCPPPPLYGRHDARGAD